ncbi:MAG: methyltransferase domain-containing protein [Dehalococcoidia bacterium]|nr:methyltransferase domain-containing protein [Dehalococcoidia bacterium]
MSVLTEIDQIIALLEARVLPVNINDPKNRKLEDKFRKDMEKYFQSLRNAFPYHKLADIYNANVKEVLAPPKPLEDDWLDPLVKVFTSTLLFKLNGWLATVYISGSVQMISWGKTQKLIPITFEGPPMESAIKWAEKYCAQLVTKMDAETKRQLAKVISDGIANKRGVDGLARDIKGAFDNMTKYRSELIARTETSHALRAAAQDRMKDMGVTGKEWVLGSGGAEGNCDLCITNADAGVISVDKEFPYPDPHPGCTCSIAPVMMDKQAEAMTANDWKAEYKDGLPHWAEDVKPSVFAKEFIAMMKSHKQDSLLEIGCGNGRDSILFAKAGFKVTSIDIVPKAIKLAKENAQKAKVEINFEVANVEELPFEDEKFGAVFSLSVLHSTDLEKSLPEVYRVIKLGGVAFIYIYGDTQYKSGKKTEDVIDWQGYLADLKSLGFRVLDSYTKDEREFDEYDEKHRIFVVHLEK